METNDLNAFLSQKRYNAVPIREDLSGLLLISVKVNGIEGMFILDTGAGVSVVNSRYADRLLLTVQKDKASFSGAGAGAQGLEVIPSEGNRIEIGNYITTDFTFAVMGFEHVSQALAEAGSEEFLGVIGVNLLKPGRAIIDYGAMTLYLLSEE